MEFSRKTIEQIEHYVYCLLDPRDNRIFYVGKGNGNRVFAHMNGAIANPTESDKVSLIRDILTSGHKVKHFILRNGIKDEATAFEIESTVIDLLTFDAFAHLSSITNIVSGHHTWDRGIKTVDEIEALYAAVPISDKEIVHNVLIININRTYKPGVSPYEATRQHWKLDVNKARKVQFVLSEFKGIFRAIYQPTKWLQSKEKGRWHFEGNEVADPQIRQLYLNKACRSKMRGQANPIRYVLNQAGV